MPKHNEDFSNAEQEEKNKFHGGQDLVPSALDYLEPLKPQLHLQRENHPRCTGFPIQGAWHPNCVEGLDDPE